MTTINALIDGESIELHVEEFHPYEPAAYVTDPGWTTYDLSADVEYFVSTSGEVYRQPEDDFVGVAPAIMAAADQLDAQTVYRLPYVGEGADGARRSAQIDRDEADTLAQDDPRHASLRASADRWDTQAKLPRDQQP